MSDIKDLIKKQVSLEEQFKKTFLNIITANVKKYGFQGVEVRNAIKKDLAKKIPPFVIGGLVLGVTWISK